MFEFKFKNNLDDEVINIYAENEDKAWIKLLGKHISKYSEALYLSEIKQEYELI